MNIKVVWRNAAGHEVDLNTLDGDVLIELDGPKEFSDRRVRLVVDAAGNRVEFVGKLALSAVTAGKTGAAVL